MPVQDEIFGLHDQGVMKSGRKKGKWIGLEVKSEIVDFVVEVELVNTLLHGQKIRQGRVRVVPLHDS